MAAIITISPGHDASYPWRQIGTAAEAGGAKRSTVEYYQSPADKGGEPPGTWRGSGVADLGFAEGQVIEREVFERLYGEFIDPRDPSRETRLGRAPQRFRSADEIFAELAALEPEALDERLAELMVEAKSQVRTPVQYFDATFSVSKSITLLHASALANAARSAAVGDKEATAYWQQAADDVWACIQAGNRAALDYLQREAGYTRSGYHGRRAAAVPTGRWEDAHAFVIGSFAQHTSRDGDPQLHIHNLILNRVRRERDGAYRTLDSRALYEHRGAAAAIAALVMESALSREFGTGWVARADGHGREVRGVSQALMDEFSSRRQSITALTSHLAAEFEAQHGRAPDAHALDKLRQWANHASRRAKPGEPLDLATEVRRWAARARAGEAGALEPVMPAVSTRRGPGAVGPAEPRPIWELSPGQAREVLAQALARVQEAQPTWRKADLIRHLGELLPDDVACRDDASAAALLTELADQAIAGGASQEVLALEAPEWPRVPDVLRRSDGRSIYRPHGSTRYATLAQLNLEERLTTQAQQSGVPRLEPETAAQLLGADQAQLEAQIRAEAQPSDAETPTGSGLNLDQAAAAYLALTGDRRAELLVGPAGSGKTRVAGEIARLWQAAGMGQVYGLATSQAARNLLLEAGVHLADNTAAFLGHLEGQREGLGTRPVAPGTLLLLDEASMMSIADMAAIMRLACERDCRVLIAGDHEQLAAVEGGGGMLMLTRQLGHIQLAEPVRFSTEWERDASLRLRRGDITVLTEYDEHGRLRGGSPDEAMELASRAFVADHLAGRDALLLARTGEQARELSRRVRDDLIRYGLVSPGPTVALRHSAVASCGDLIAARANQRTILAGEPGRWLTNRDVLRVEELGLRTVTVRRLLDRANGRQRWSAPFDVPRTYLFSHCDLAYATTPHAAQGRSVDVAHVLVDGLGDRQGLYVAMSRGRHANYAYCVTGFPQLADTRPGSRPAAELRRAHRLTQEQAGQTPASSTSPPGDSAVQRDPVSVLADVAGRDGTVLTATETLRAEMSNADHLGVLGAIWYDLARRAQTARFEQLVYTCLPQPEADQVIEDPACTWLWRSLREAEAAGLDAAGTLQTAIASRSLTDARHPARVLDARIRRRLDSAVPQPRDSWSARIPSMDDPDLQRFMTELAAAMDDRVLRLGQHIAETATRWATRALGPVPTDPDQRVGWERRAASIGAYRELYGHTADHDAIGPEPARTSPEARVDWHTALAALGQADGLDLRGCSDAQLYLRRASYQRQTSWAPPHVGEELRLARLQARTAWENAIRASHEARAAVGPEAAARHRALAIAWQTMARKATLISGQLASAQETRRQWETHTGPERQMAVAADLELRRRHPGLRLPALASAGLAQVPSDSLRHSTPDRPARPAAAKTAPRQCTSAVTGRKSESQLREELGLTPETAANEIPERIRRICEQTRVAREILGQLRSQPPSASDDGLPQLGTAWPGAARPDRDAILQPPKPHIVPARALQQWMADGEASLEPELE